MLKLGFVLLVAGLFAVTTAACGGGSASAGDASTSGGDGPIGPDGRMIVEGGPILDVSGPGDFISGDVDGVTVRVEVDLMAGTSGLAAGQIWVNGGPPSGSAWNVWFTNSVGTSTCPPGWIAVYDPPGGGGTLRSDAGGSCSVTVTRAAPEAGDVVEGTFTATLKSMSTASPMRTAAVTNGAFHVTRNFQ
jgi:hypothetical protein